ncbi:MAG TPA: type II toxin-antitoxin system VapC family toxin [Candidatus Limnocylindrales bacterium]|nr:type II toxin-antitoxin system VapC family toxin [Candidatus Limnocylindrales bacterium]
MDASVVLAWLQDEPGSDQAEPLLMEGLISAANWSEVLQKSRQHGVDAELAARLLASFGLNVIGVTKDDGERAAALWRKGGGLSLADRLCLALGLRLSLDVATADRRWDGLPEAPEILLIR